ncbi:unnamed protein product [Calicophoron daubneyi]|uniref:G-patch domain-containing protein n=1 Tax=Calicophoron daubneyi TaxID=300641 RepID=A0AAV2TJR3_CALDB
MNDPAHCFPSEVHSNRGIVRHDPVTARAISRLSHGVAQLNASTNPNALRSLFRGRRCKHSMKEHSDSAKSRLPLPNSGYREDNRITSDETKKAATGSKRKWQPEKCASEGNMEVDQSSLHCAIQVEEQCMDDTHTPSFYLPTSHVTDHSMGCDHYSSCSSMLSLTGSSDETSSDADSSHENEADVDEEDEEDAGHSRTYRRRPLSQSCMDLFGMPLSPSYSRPAQSGRLTEDLPVCGGDSSDGLSVIIKMPRLASMTVAPVTSNNKTGSRRSTRKDSSSLTRRSSESSGTDSTHQRESHSRDHKRHSSGRASGSSASSYTKAKTSSSSIPRKAVTQVRDSSFSSNSSSEDGQSRGLGQGRISAGSYEDLANDEQSDFPADEFKPVGDLTSASYRSGQSRMGGGFSRAGKSASHSRRGWSAQSTSSSGCSAPVPPKPPHFHHEVDSELEDIMNGTWPLLSHRAKTGYVKGVSEAGCRKLSNPARSKGSVKSCTPKQPSIHFVPSKLDVLDARKSVKSSKHRQNNMPTPPWMSNDRQDSDEEFEQTEFSDPHVSPDRIPGSCSRPGLGFSHTRSSSAIPIPESNMGHQLLRRMGWEPGTGLGSDSKGTLDPVGCASFYTRQS